MRHSGGGKTKGDEETDGGRERGTKRWCYPMEHSRTRYCPRSGLRHAHSPHPTTHHSTTALAVTKFLTSLLRDTHTYGHQSKKGRPLLVNLAAHRFHSRELNMISRHSTHAASTAPTAHVAYLPSCPLEPHPLASTIASTTRSRLQSTPGDHPSTTPPRKNLYSICRLRRENVARGSPAYNPTS